MDRIRIGKDDTIFANVKQVKKVPVTVLLGALGFSEDEILDKLTYKDFLKNFLEKYPMKSQDESLVELNKITSW